MTDPTATPDPAAAPPAAADPPASGTPPAAELKMPDGLPPAYWDPKSGVKQDALLKDFPGLHKFKADADARMAAVPDKLEGYKLELPKEFEVPAGMQVKFDEKDPRLTAARAYAKELGLDQAAFSKLLTLEAGRTVAEYKSNIASIEAEQSKLGEKFPEREKALTAYVASSLTGSAEQKAAKHKALQMVLTSAAAFEALEDVMNKGGKIPASQQAPDSPKPTEQPVTDRWYGNQQKVS